MSLIIETGLLMILGGSAMLYGLLNFVRPQTEVVVPAHRRISDPWLANP